MADEEGSRASKARRTTRLIYFYLNGKLHKKLLINRATDSIVTWCYPDGKRYTYTYSDVLRNKERAFTTTDVTQMLGRGRRSLEDALAAGAFPAPQRTYTIDEHRRPFKYMWHENDIMAAHDYFSSRHRGRPRNDGMITPQRMPSKRELRAMIRQETITYVKEGDRFVPTWLAKDFL